MDIWGGFQQYPRIAAQLVTGKLISSTTGRELRLGEGYRPLTRKDIIERFFESKANPVVGFALRLAEGRSFDGTKFNVPLEVRSLFVPMVVQDLLDLAQQDPKLLPLILPGVFGVGVQTYGEKRSPVRPTTEPWWVTLRR